MATYVYECPECRARCDVSKSMGESGQTEYCPRCFDELIPMRRIFTPQGFIMRPSGHRLQPGERTSTPGLAFDDFRYEMERGELREDATPVTLSPTELAAFDNPPITIPPDPARDRALHQLVAQHWTEDLSPGVAYNRELAAKAAREHAEAGS